MHQQQCGCTIVDCVGAIQHPRRHQGSLRLRDPRPMLVSLTANDADGAASSATMQSAGDNRIEGQQLLTAVTAAIEAFAGGIIASSGDGCP